MKHLDRFLNCRLIFRANGYLSLHVFRKEKKKVNIRALYAAEYAICYIIEKFATSHNHPLPFNEVTTKHFRRKSIMHPKVTENSTSGNTLLSKPHEQILPPPPPLSLTLHSCYSQLENAHCMPNSD